MPEACRNSTSKFNPVAIMFINSTPPFGRAWRSAGFLAFVSAMSFLAQVHAQNPTIVSEVPANGASGVSPSAAVVFTFSTNMNTNLTSAMFQDTNGATLTTTATWSVDEKILTCTPTPAFPSPDEIIWFVSGQDTLGHSLGGIPEGIFTIGGATNNNPCGPAPHTNTSFVLEESWLYIQTNAGPPVHYPTVPYGITAEVSLISNLTATAATLTLPNSTVSNLANFLGDGQTFLMSDIESNVTELNADWPNGNYAFKMTGTTPAFPTVTVALNFTQPNSPQITDFAATQAVDSTKPFTLSWNAFSNRVATNEIVVNIGYNACAGTGFVTNLPGTATSTTIPAGVLQPGSNYVDSLIVFLSTTGTSNASPKYTAGAVRGSVTQFTLTTAGGSGSGSLSFSNAVLSGGKLAFEITAPPGKTITVQYSPTLASGSWTTLVTTNSGTGTITVTDTPSKAIPSRFYRAHQ
jgi:hypothetical protein